MNLVTTFTVGGMRCHALEAGRQWLDGGAMFGVVPKPLWQRRIEPDERNRIPLALRCLLVEHDAGPVLIDTGLGNKESKKFRDIYGVENAGSAGPTQLDDALAAVGQSAADIRYVINTHLHFDHAGGNTFNGDGRDAQIAFPNATYVVQRAELEFAGERNERTAASYLPPNFDPIAEAGRWELVAGEHELLPGVRLLPTPGHVPHHQSVLLTDRGETACFLGDLVPTSAHIPLPWIMGYDLEPLVTLETKRRVLGEAAAEEWTLVFEHDPRHATGRAVPDLKSFEFAPLDTAQGAA
jgi:glyoxylase-like metal-dependent hydrolase (beta-lactamase superfamily II)